MDTTSKTSFISQSVPDENVSLFGERSQNTSSEIIRKADTPLFLVTMYKGIGDAVAVGLSAVDQIIFNDPDAYGKIDVLCNSIQAEIFEHDPRINRIILADKSLFPTPEVTMWLKGIVIDSKTAELIYRLRNRHYTAVFPGMFTPGLYVRLHSCIMYPNLFNLGKDLLALRNQIDMPLSKMTRRMVNSYFGRNTLSTAITDEIPLYICSEQVQKAMAIVRNMKEASQVSTESSKLLVVASDTASVVTRPPLDLLATAVAEALRSCPNLVVCILQSYTDTTASEKLFQALTCDFHGRVFMMPNEPRARLLDVTAFIDQSDVFVTGDTGLMHLAVANKRLSDGHIARFFPRNSVKIITLFGGTNPSFYGYSGRTIILGRGRKEQAAFRPGIAKESYKSKGQNLFDHISPQQLTEAIVG